MERYTDSICPKNDTWFADGGSCGLGHECKFCESDPNNRQKAIHHGISVGKYMDIAEYMLGGIEPRRGVA